jgi:hypothetical protein|nr:hypothetical protein [uncultured Prevotella sp.]
METLKEKLIPKLSWLLGILFFLSLLVVAQNRTAKGTVGDASDGFLLIESIIMVKVVKAVESLTLMTTLQFPYLIIQINIFFGLLCGIYATKAMILGLSWIDYLRKMEKFR